MQVTWECMAYSLRVCDMHVFVSKPRRNLQNSAYLHTRLPVAKYVKKIMSAHVPTRSKLRRDLDRVRVY